MKTISITTTLTLVAFLGTSILSQAQTPDAVNYQAVARDAAGDIMMNQAIGVTFIVHRASAVGIIVYEEDHAGTNTNQFGLFSLQLGQGTPVTGTLAGIDWSADSHWLEVEVDGNSVGAQRLIAVPYALLARDVENDAVDDADSDPTNELQTLSISGNQLSISSGNTVTVPGGGGGSPWTEVGGEVYYTGNVGIGTTTPGALLDVAGRIWQTATGQSVFIGEGAGANDDLIGNLNVFVGYKAGNSNTGGERHTAIGHSALQRNTTGGGNTASGFEALLSNTTGIFNTASGFQALFSNTTGRDNTASGFRALRNNTTGDLNTANGIRALVSNTTGRDNTASGFNALGNNSSGNNNTALGYHSGGFISTGSNNTAIGNNARVPNGTLDNQVRVGDGSITYAGVEVAWTITSDKRLKEDIQNSNIGLDFISKLRPVSYARNNDESKKREYGFIAQELQDALISSGASDNGVISKDAEGMLGVRYNDLMAPMVKAIQEQQDMIEELQLQNQQLEQRMEELAHR